ncbi:MULTISPECIES: MFS transporter [Bacillus]|uniref:MFS transporter n=1 Tax=Bacillus TaxID=1386 RepID=UPI000EE82E1F|nr:MULTISPECIES: MFS transporter [Bacillus]MCM3062871.1 MFS transporter [Bacillus altitudinis]MCM3075575.1 MFS transporter [Bacillus altitudinis]WEZ72189.1 MFS transporter [Bacillus altitudinis]HCO80885.1 MFS transporter [Bacillus sp. (in: firmicutes)]
MVSENLKKIRMSEKVGYASGDFACNLIYATVSTYLLFFYTDVYGLSAAAAGTMFLVVRAIDALADPFIGAMVDRTNSRFGRFRPYLLFGALPFAVLAILCFTTPDFSEMGKLIYAYITYVGLSLTYTFINVPYGALTSAMTRNNQEVVSITSVRMLFANLGGLVVAFFVPFLATFLGDTTGNTALGWQITMAFLGVLGGGLLIFCFKSTNERVTLQKPEEKIKFSDLFVQLRVNRPLVVLSIFFIIIFGVNSISNSVGIYYVTYNLGREDLVKWYGLIGSLPALMVLPFIPKLHKLLGKKKLLNYSLLLNIVGLLALLVIPPSQITLILIFRLVAAAGSITAGAYMWALIPETVEYGEYKTGKRMGGLIYAVIGFFFKFGMALGGIVPGLVLDRFGYIANQVQTPEALLGILITTTVIPVCLLILAMVDINFYNLDEEKHKKVVRELENRDKVYIDHMDDFKM